MLRKYSVSMMVLLVAASVIGTNGVVYQYVEGQAPPAPKQQGIKGIVGVGIGNIDFYASSDGKACIVEIKLSERRPNDLGLPLGSTIDILAPDTSACVLLGQAKIMNRGVFLDVEKLTTLNALPPKLRATGDYQVAQLYAVHRVEFS
jgi:hypothetical protein